MADTFADALAAFAEKARANMGRAVELAIEALIVEASRPEDAGGRMPVRTGRLRESIKVYINGALAGEGVAQAIAAARGVESGDTVDISWGELGTRAPYARLAEFGGVHIRAHFYARAAAERWPEIFAEAVRQAAGEG